MRLRDIHNTIKRHISLLMGVQQYPSSTDAPPPKVRKPLISVETNRDYWVMEGVNPIIAPVGIIIFDQKPVEPPPAKVEMCSYQDCFENAEYLDIMDSPVCEDCMEREVQQEWSDYSDFRSI